MPVSDSGRLIQPLSKRVVQGRVSLGVAAGGHMGDAEIPSQGERGSTAHTLYQSLSVQCAHTTIVAGEV